MSRKLIIAYIFIFLFSNLFSITISLINNETITGNLLFIKNNDYYVEMGDKLYIINNKVIYEVSNTSQVEMDIMMFGTKDKSIDKEKYTEIITKDKWSLKQTWKKYNCVIKVGFETLGVFTSSVHMPEGWGETGETSFHIKKDVKPGFSFSGEYHYDLLDNIVVGAGFRFQSLREFRDNEEDKFVFLPVYGLLSATVFKQDDIDIGAIGNLGYNFFFEDKYFAENNKLTGGLYYGVGLTFQIYQKYMLDVIYKANLRHYVVTNNEDEVLNYTYNSILISIGYILLL